MSPSRVAVGQNAPMPNRSPELQPPFGDRYPVRGTRRDRLTASPSASPAEAAAIVAAIGRFMRDTAPRLAASTEGLDRWTRAAMLEGVARAGLADEPDPWINT
jgi:hypothetical protein